MATKLFLRNTAANGIGTYYDMGTTAGGASATGVVDTVASGTEIQWTRTAGGTVLEWISGRSPAGGWTLSGTMTFSIWANQSHMNANCGARARVFKRTAAGVESEIGGGPYNDGVEFGTSAAEMTWTGTPTSTAFAEDDRLIVRYYITNQGTMGGGFTCTLTYNAADAATGDSFFQINENVTFKSETLSAPAGTASETDSAFGLARTLIHTAGLSSEANAALGLGRVSIHVAGLSSEAGTAFPLGIALGATTASETDSALALGASLVKAAGTAIETGTAFSLGIGTGAGRAGEVSAAFPLGIALGVGMAVEADAALAPSPLLSRLAGMASEADSGLAPASILIRAAGLVSEADTAFALTSMLARAAGMATETGTAFALASGGGPIVVPAGRADETGTAFAPGSILIRPIGLAAEMDTAFALAVVAAQVLPIGMATEADDGFTLVWWRQYPLAGMEQAQPGNADQGHPLGGQSQSFPGNDTQPFPLAGTKQSYPLG